MAKLKQGIELFPFGPDGKGYSGKIDDATARFFLDSGRLDKESFDEMPKEESTGAEDENPYNSIPKIRERLDELQFTYNPKGLTRKDFDGLLAEAEAIEADRLKKEASTGAEGGE